MPLHFDDVTRSMLIKNSVYVIQVTYMELTLDTEAYVDSYPTLFQEEYKGVEMAILFENNELLLGEKASTVTRILQVDDSEVRLNLRSIHSV